MPAPSTNQPCDKSRPQLSRRIKGAARQWSECVNEHAIDQAHEDWDNGSGNGNLGVRQDKQGKAEYSGAKAFNAAGVNIVGNETRRVEAADGKR